jgi:hypothetical protein
MLIAINKTKKTVETNTTKTKKEPTTRRKIKGSLPSGGTKDFK